MLGKELKVTFGVSHRTGLLRSQFFPSGTHFLMKASSPLKYASNLLRYTRERLRNLYPVRIVEESRFCKKKPPHRNYLFREVSPVQRMGMMCQGIRDLLMSWFGCDICVSQMLGMRSLDIDLESTEKNYDTKLWSCLMTSLRIRWLCYGTTRSVLVLWCLGARELMTNPSFAAER